MATLLFNLQKVIGALKKLPGANTTTIKNSIQGIFTKEEKNSQNLYLVEFLKLARRKLKSFLDGVKKSLKEAQAAYDAVPKPAASPSRVPTTENPPVIA